MTPLPVNLEKVAEAGGWEERAKQKAQEELIEKMSKIPSEKWKNMLDTVISVENIVDKGGLDLSLIDGWTDELKDTFKTELEYALAPLKNELMGLINEILAPFLPLIQDALTSITTMTSRGVGFLEALFTGKLEQFMRDLQLEMQDEVQAWQVQRSEAFWSSPAGKAWFKHRYGIDMDALSAQGTAGGVYSGQFAGMTFSDADIARIEEILARFNLGGFTG